MSRKELKLMSQRQFNHQTSSEDAPTPKFNQVTKYSSTINKQNLLRNKLKGHLKPPAAD
jgi:hypothetical protein